MPGRAPRDGSVRGARELLGVAADADAAQIARAYRHQARRLHPDVSLDPHAVEKFRTLCSAYQLVLDAAGEEGRPAATAPAPVVHQTARVGLDIPLTVTVTPGPPLGRGNPDWIVAGPVHVHRPPRDPDGPASTPGGPR